jgi:DedD protein
MSGEAARQRARRRLVGAGVLVAIGVVIFPMLFDTTPRPLPLDIPIETPARDAGAPAVVMKPAPEDLATTTPADKPEGTQRQAADANRDAAASSVPAPPPVVAEKPAEPLIETTPAGKAPAAVPSKGGAEAARALAALEGKPAPGAKPPPAETSAASGRFVVQVGAFSEAGSATQARQRVEKLGLKTYTQVVDTAAGKRIRVRIGPYGERADAERAAARLKQAGLQPAVLTL